MKIVIILPTYNERENIRKMIPLLQQEILPTIKNHQVSLLIVDDTSPDGTADEVKAFMHKWHTIKLLSGTKQGLGAAYVRGMQYAMKEMQADAVMEFDADFQHDPYDIPRLISAMDKGADCVIGSRYIAGGSIPKEWGFDRKFLSVVGNWVARVVWFNFTVHDVTSGFKLTKSSYLRKIDLDNLLSHTFAYKMQILHDILQLKAKVVEVPIVFKERGEGKSKISTSDQFESLYVVLRLGIYDHKRFFKFLVTGGTGFFLQMVTTAVSIQLGAEQFIAAMIGGEVAILSNFLINNTWTFGDTKHIKEQGHFFNRLIKFNVASLASIFTQGGVVYLAVNFLGSHQYLFGYDVPTSLIILVPTIILIIIPMNYFIYNYIIWKTQHLKNN
ncbi:MAG: glycosyltransferase [Patescibacteria group bacterium]